MRYTIHGFSQQRAIELGIDNDDLLLLRWLVDFSATGEMKNVVIENQIYYWVHYDSICKELPIISHKKDTIYRRIKQMVDKNILCQYTQRDKSGTYSYYGFGKVYLSLISDSAAGGFGNKSEGGTEKNPYGVRKKIPTKDPSTIYNLNTNENNKSVSQSVPEERPTDGQTEITYEQPEERLNENLIMCNDEQPEVEQTELERILDKAQIYLFDARLFIIECIKKLYSDNSIPIKLKMGLKCIDIHERLFNMNYRHVESALRKMRDCKTNKELYFMKCLLTAIVELEIDDYITEIQDD
jgi:hypothetical protein